MAIVDLLVDDSSWLMNQLHVIVLVRNYYGVEVGENLKIHDYFIGRKTIYFRCISTSIQRKYGDVFLEST